MGKESIDPVPAGEAAVDGDAEAGVSGDDDELRQLPDQVLQGKMQRMQRGVDGGIAARLPDGGKTYRLKLLAIGRELARRRAAAASSTPPPPSPSPHPPQRQGEPTDGGRCEPIAQSCSAKSSDIQVTSSLPAQCIPARFHRRLPETRTDATLICGGKSWAMSYCGDLKVKKLDADWMEFVVDNRLQVNDACVFELVVGTKEEVVFHMQILRGSLPEEITSKGATADEPLVIVD